MTVTAPVALRPVRGAAADHDRKAIG